jgi:hypothetical protein
MKHVVFQHLKGCFSTFPSCPLPAPASSPSASALRNGTAQHAVDATCGNRSLVVAMNVLIFHHISSKLVTLDVIYHKKKVEFGFCENQTFAVHC